MENKNLQRLKSIVNNKIGFYNKKPNQENTDKELEIINRYDSHSDSESSSSDNSQKNQSNINQKKPKGFNSNNLGLHTDKIEFKENKKIFRDSENKKNLIEFETQDEQEKLSLGKNFLRFTQSINKNQVSVKENFKNLDFYPKKNDEVGKESIFIEKSIEKIENEENLMKENNIKSLNFLSEKKNIKKTFFNFEFFGNFFEFLKKENNFSCNPEEFNKQINEIDLNTIKVNLVEKLDECTNSNPEKLVFFIENFFEYFFSEKIFLEKNCEEKIENFCEFILEKNKFSNLEFFVKFFYFILLKFNSIFSMHENFSYKTPENPLLKEDLNENSTKLLNIPTIKKEEKNNSENLKNSEFFYFKIFGILSKINIFLVDKFLSYENSNENFTFNTNQLINNIPTQSDNIKEIKFNMINLFSEYNLIEKNILLKAYEISLISNQSIDTDKNTTNSDNSQNDLFLYSKKNNINYNPDEEISEIYFLDYTRKINLIKIFFCFFLSYQDNPTNFKDLNNNSYDYKIKKIITHFTYESFSIIQSCKKPNFVGFNTHSTTTEKKNENKIINKNKFFLLSEIYQKKILIKNTIFKIGFFSQKKIFEKYENLKNILNISYTEAKDLFNLTFKFLKIKFFSNIFIKIIDLICLLVENNLDFLDKLVENLINFYSDFLNINLLNNEEKISSLNPKILNLYNSHFGVYISSDGTSISIYTLIFLKIFSMIFLKENKINDFYSDKIDKKNNSWEDSDTDKDNPEENKPLSLNNLFEKTFEIFVIKVIDSSNQNLLNVFYCLMDQIKNLKYSIDFSICIQLQIKFFILFSNLITNNNFDNSTKKYFFSLYEIFIVDSLEDFEDLKNNNLCLEKLTFLNEKVNIRKNTENPGIRCECFNCLFINTNSKKVYFSCSRCGIETNLILQIIENEEEEFNNICGFCKMNKFLKDINFPVYNNILENKENCLVKKNNEKKNLKKNKKLKIKNNSENSSESENEPKKNKENLDFSNLSSDVFSESDKKIKIKNNLHKKFLSYHKTLLDKGNLFIKLNILNFIKESSTKEIFDENINTSFEIFTKIFIFENKKINFYDFEICESLKNFSYSEKKQENSENFLSEIKNFYYINKNKILNIIPDFIIENSTIKHFYFYFFYVNFLFAGNLKILDIIFNDLLPWGIRFKSIKLMEKFFEFEKQENIFNLINIDIYSTLLKDNSFHIRDSSLDMILTLYENTKISDSTLLKILYENINESSFIIRKKIIKILINLCSNTKAGKLDRFYLMNIQIIFLGKISDTTESIKIKNLIYDFYFETFNNKKKNEELIYEILRIFIELLKESSSGYNGNNDNSLSNSGVFSLTMATNCQVSNFIYFERIKLIFKNLFFVRKEKNGMKENSINFLLDFLFDEYLLNFNQKRQKEVEDDINIKENSELVSVLNIIKIISSYTVIKNQIFFENLLDLMMKNFDNFNEENLIKQLICQIFTNLLRYSDFKNKFIGNLKDCLMKLILNKQISVMLPALETYFVCLSKNLITLDQIKELAEKNYIFLLNFISKEKDLINYLNIDDKDNDYNNKNNTLDKNNIFNNLNLDSINNIIWVITKSLNLLYYILYLSNDEILKKIFDFVIIKSEKIKTNSEEIKNALFSILENLINFYSNLECKFTKKTKNIYDNIILAYNSKKKLLYRAFSALGFLWIRFPDTIPTDNSKSLISKIFSNLNTDEEKLLTVKTLTNIFLEIKLRITISQNFQINKNLKNSEPEKKTKKQKKTILEKNLDLQTNNLNLNNSKIIQYDPLTENLDINFDYGIIHLFFECFISDISNFIKSPNLILRSNSINLIKLIIEQGNINMYSISPAIFSALFDYNKDIRINSVTILEKYVRNSKEKFMTNLKPSLVSAYDFQKNLYIEPKFFNTFVKDYKFNLRENKNKKNSESKLNLENNFPMQNNFELNFFNSDENIFELFLYRINKNCKNNFSFNLKFLEKIYETFEDVKNLGQQGGEIIFGSKIDDKTELIEIIKKFEFFEFIADILADYKFNKSSEIFFLIKKLMAEYELEIQFFNSRFKEFKNKNKIKKEKNFDDNKNEKKKNIIEKEGNNLVLKYFFMKNSEDGNNSEIKLFFEMKFLCSIFIISLKSALIHFLLSKYDYFEKNEEFYNTQIKTNYNLIKNKDVSTIYSNEDVDETFPSILISKEFRNFKFYEFYSFFDLIYEELIDLSLNKSNQVKNKKNKDKIHENKIMRLLEILKNLKNFIKLKNSEIKNILGKYKKVNLNLTFRLRKEWLNKAFMNNITVNFDNNYNSGNMIGNTNNNITFSDTKNKDDENEKNLKLKNFKNTIKENETSENEKVKIKKNKKVEKNYNSDLPENNIVKLSNNNGRNINNKRVSVDIGKYVRECNDDLEEKNYNKTEMKSRKKKKLGN